MKLGDKTVSFIADLLRSTDGIECHLTILERVSERNGVRARVEFRGKRIKLIVEHNGYDLQGGLYDDDTTIIEFLQKIELHIRQKFSQNVIKVKLYHDVYDERDWEGPGHFIKGYEYNALDADATPVREYDKLRVRF